MIELRFGDFHSSFRYLYVFGESFGDVWMFK